MQVVLLGTAAGGGFPQWNCWCPVCRVGRADPERAHPRTQSSIAIRAEGRGWVLCNASPDVREQIGRLSASEPAASQLRHSPIEAIVLTDAELDHTLGLVLLRESRQLTVYATDPVERIVADDSRILPVTRAFAGVAVERLPLDRALPLQNPAGQSLGLTAEAFALSSHRPRFAAEGIDLVPGHTVGILFREVNRDAIAAFVPGVGILNAAVVDRLARADLVLIDGTCWADDELVTLGISTSTARDMGHLPISGPGGSLGPLGRLAASRGPATRIVYTHINNTNPILLEDSPERRAVVGAGLIVGEDGMTFTV